MSTDDESTLTSTCCVLVDGLANHPLAARELFQAVYVNGDYPTHPIVLQVGERLIEALERQFRNNGTVNIWRSLQLAVDDLYARGEDASTRAADALAWALHNRDQSYYDSMYVKDGVCFLSTE